jgi:hypothetical protein
MARPYSAGGVSIAQSNPTCRRPAAAAACDLQQSSGPTFPPGIPGAILIVSDSTLHRIEGQGERVRERGPDREALSPAFAFLRGSIWRAKPNQQAESLRAPAP